MWKRFDSNVILKDIFKKYFKIVELATITILRNVKDEHTFSTITFIKSKLKNGWTTNQFWLFGCMLKIFLLFIHVSIPQSYHKLEWSKIPTGVGIIKCWGNFMRMQHTWCFRESYILHLNKLVQLKSYLLSYLLTNLDKDVNTKFFVLQVCLPF